MTTRILACWAGLLIIASTAMGQVADQASRPPVKPVAPAKIETPQTTAATDAARPPAAPEKAPEAIPESIPPEDKPQETGQKAAPAAPPIRETLREDDFQYSACLLALHDLGTVYQEVPAISQPNQRDCGIARPVRVDQILPGITLQGGAVMRCDTARALGFWVRDFIRPTAGRLPGAPQLSGLQLGTTYDCRGRVGGQAQAKLSEHAFGNAIDITGFAFRDAETIPVIPRQDSGDLIESFQRAARASACLFFTTVLGPGTNKAHDNHLHLDIAARNGDWRLCQ